MKNGYKIIDSDTHVGPNLETLKIYASDRLKERWSEFDPFLQPVTLGGHFLSVNPMKYGRELGTEHAGEESEKGGDSPLRGAVTKAFDQPPAEDVSNLNAKGRLEDMDIEGVDVNLIIPGTFGNAATTFDNELAVELYDAYHRYIADYCSEDEDRLKATILLPAQAPDEAVRMVKELGDEKWVASVSVVLPEGVPIDDPVLYPVWSAIGDYDLPLLHHSFFYEPPYFPGYRDIWGNVVIARAAAHPWGAQRLLAYLTLSGLFDVYPNLRIGFAECSAGWLPSWLIRLEGQADYMAAKVPFRQMSPTEYAQNGRIYCGIELYEGAGIAKSVTDLLGDGVLMYSSDYPHNQAEFPVSTEMALEWEDALGKDVMTKLMSTNAETYMRIL
ncbi:amidohydrolase family protein [Candidatus Poriferisocius sp.]|uniref:amidohydrolase family protein n=1 Tax=Candidatus Poriferisocius sp. TaxID=3101276 RepID=UPI003B5CDC72